MKKLLHVIGLTSLVFLACGGPTSQVAEESVLQPETGKDQPAGTAAAGGDSPEGVPTAIPAGQRAESLTGEGLQLLRDGRISEGRDALEKAVGTGSAGAVAYYNLAVAQVRLGDERGAVDNARVAVQLSRGAEKAVALYTSLMIAGGQARMLVQILEDVVSNNPDSLAAGNMLARAKIAMGRAPEGLRDASQLLKKDQTNTEVMKTIARAYLAMQRTEAAKLVLHQTLELNRDAEVLDMLGQMAAREGEKRKAIAYFQEAVELNTTLADAHNNLGVLYHEAGDYDSAIREFESAIATLPSYSTAHMNMGNSFRKKMEFSKAEAAYRKALRIDPDCADCYFNLGVNSLENKGTEKDEPEHYRKAMEHFTRYKEIRSGPLVRGDEADKYLDEARRMAEYLEKEAQIREAPPEETETQGETSEEEFEEADDEWEDDGEEWEEDEWED